MLIEKIKNSEKIIKTFAKQDQTMISDSDRLAITTIENQIAIMKVLRNMHRNQLIQIRG